MKKQVVVIFLVAGMSFPARIAWAGGAIMARQRMQQQMAIQQAMQQQAIQQQIAAQVSAQAQAHAQQSAQQAVQQAAQQAVLQAQYQAQIAAAQVVLEAQRAAVQTAAQTAIATQYQAQQVAAQLAAQKAAVVHGVAQEKVSAALQAGLLQQIIEAQGGAASSPVDPAQIQEITTLDNVLQSLDQSSQVWPLMADMEAKAVVVDQYIERFRQEGVTINQDGYHYAQMIDGLSSQSPEMLQQPFPRLLEIVAILEYDFNNGYDKDAMAQQILRSPEAVAANKKRLGID